MLPICDKILERLIYNKVFEFFTGNELISSNQSGFKPGDSCINQLLCITHDIYQSFDGGLETRAAFLDIPKAFDKVWHEGLLYKLMQNDISGNLLNIIKIFLSLRKQRIVSNGQHSNGLTLKQEFPKDNPDPNKQAQKVIFSRRINKINHPQLLFNQNLVKSSSSQKHLGMVLDTKFDFNLRTKNVQSKVNKTIGLLREIQNILPRKSVIAIYKSFRRPHLDYGDIIYDRAYNSAFHQNIESFQYNAALAIMGAIRGTFKEKTFPELGFESL